MLKHKKTHKHNFHTILFGIQIKHCKNNNNIFLTHTYNKSTHLWKPSQKLNSESKVKMVWRSQRSSTGTAQIAQLAAWMKLKLAPEYRTLLPEGNPGTNRRWLQCDGHTTGPLEGGCRCWQTSSHTTSAVVWFEKTREIDEKFYPPTLQARFDLIFGIKTWKYKLY